MAEPNINCGAFTEMNVNLRKPYHAPRIEHELELETRAGSIILGIQDPGQNLLFTEEPPKFGE